MLKELRGPEASQKPRSPREEFRRDRFFVELAWLGDEAAVKAVEELLTAEDQRSWKSAKPLFPSEAEPEERFLSRLLEKPSDIAYFAREWIVFRLGNLRAVTAVPVLQAILADGLWGMEDREAQEALVAIGGPEVEKASLELLDPHGRGQDRGARIAALEILSELRSPQLASASRRTIKEDPDYTVVARAIGCLAGAGAEEDLGLLRSLADFWNEDKMVSRAAAEALADLRARLDYDLEGPISPR
jgi:HEAT repeat protein